MPPLMQRPGGQLPPLYSVSVLDASDIRNLSEQLRNVTAGYRL